MKACYVYLVVASDNSLYTGISSDPAHRTLEHNAGTRGAKALRGKRPVLLLRRWLCESRSAALRMEAEIKKLRPPEKWSAVLSNDSDDGSIPEENTGIVAPPTGRWSGAAAPDFSSRETGDQIADGKPRRCARAVL